VLFRSINGQAWSRDRFGYCRSSRLYRPAVKLSVSNESLAKKIAELLDADRPTVDLHSIQAGLSEINARLDRLEAVSSAPVPVPRIPQQAVHPSLDKLAIAEAIADQIFGGEGKEKACTFEPNGMPCDHCSMCNSRGF